MVRLTTAKWVTLIGVLGLSGLSSALYFTFQRERLFPVDGWFFGGFADFKSFWLGARLLADGQFGILFDQVAFNFERQTLFPFDHGHVWSYPLHVILFARPLSLLPYPLAATIWMAAGATVLLLLVRRVGAGWPLGLVIVMFSGSAFFWFYLGQLTPFTAALLVGAAYAPPTRPVLAGLCLGALSIKPQLAVFVGLLLLLSGQWRVIGIAAATTLALVLASVATVGVEAWVALFRDAVPVQQDVMLHWIPVQPLIATIRAAFVFWRASPDWGSALQLCVSLAALASVVWVARTQIPWRQKASLAISATVVGLPYILVYDHLLLVPVLLADLLDPRTGYWRFLILLLALSSASFGVLLLIVLGVPFLPMVMVLLLASQVWEAQRAQSRLARQDGAGGSVPVWA